MRLKYNDESHGYWIDGRRCKSVTTIAKIPEDTYYLDKWQKRMVAIGLASDPALIEEVAAHVADKERLDRICEKAQNAAKAHRAADAGTTAHRFTEAHDAGHAFIETELAATILATWNRVLDVGGYEIVDGMVERIVCFPDLLICGMFDRLLRRKRDGRLFIADLKTGEKAIEYPHSISVQMGIYPNAPLIAGPLNNKGETYDFEPFPDVDKDIGIVIHMPTPDRAELVEFDIAAGWECFQQVILPTLAWRKRDGLCRSTAPLLVTEENPLGSEYHAAKKLTHGNPNVNLATIAVDGSDLPVGARELPVTPAAPPPFDEPPAPELTRAEQKAALSIVRDEGAAVDPGDFKILQGRFEALGTEALAWLKGLTSEAIRANVSFHALEAKTTRRFEIIRGLLALAECEGGRDDELIRALVALALESDAPLFPAVTRGHAIGSMDVTTAAKFARLVDDFAAGQLAGMVADDGTFRLQAVGV